MRVVAFAHRGACRATPWSRSALTTFRRGPVSGLRLTSTRAKRCGFSHQPRSLRGRAAIVRDRLGVLKALAAAGFDVDERNAPAIENVYAYIARSPAALLTFQMEDVSGRSIRSTCQARPKPPIRTGGASCRSRWKTGPTRKPSGASPQRYGASVGRRPAPPPIERQSPTSQVQLIGCAAASRLRLRSGGGSVAVPESARHQPRLLVTNHAGAPGQHAWLRRNRLWKVEPQLGGAAAFERYCAALKACGSGKSSTSCRITWACWLRPIAGGATS